MGTGLSEGRPALVQAGTATEKLAPSRDGTTQGTQCGPEEAALERPLGISERVALGYLSGCLRSQVTNPTQTDLHGEKICK